MTNEFGHFCLYWEGCVGWVEDGGGSSRVGSKIRAGWTLSFACIQEGRVRWVEDWGWKFWSKYVCMITEVGRFSLLALGRKGVGWVEDWGWNFWNSMIREIWTLCLRWEGRGGGARVSAHCCLEVEHRDERSDRRKRIKQFPLCQNAMHRKQAR